MIKKIILTILGSENPILKIADAILRFPVKITQFQVLNILKDRAVINLIKKIQKERKCLIMPNDMFQIYSCAFRAKKLNGDFAEVGVYLGASAKLISEAKGDKSLHLFDTFTGLPETEPIDKWMYKGKYEASLESVKRYLSKYKNIAFYSGIFPQTAGPVKDKIFAFTHLDVDLYRSTLECLKFFYPRMVRGGIILSHDYSSLPAVKKAFDEFFTDKPELVIELPTNQCMIVKL